MASRTWTGAAELSLRTAQCLVFLCHDITWLGHHGKGLHAVLLNSINYLTYMECRADLLCETKVSKMLVPFEASEENNLPSCLALGLWKIVGRQGFSILCPKLCRRVSIIFCVQISSFIKDAIYIELESIHPSDIIVT